jgi:hypothetical protein
MRCLPATIGILLAAGLSVPYAAQSIAPAPVAAPDPDLANLALAREVIALAFPPESRHAMMTRMSDAMITQMRGALFPPTGNPSDPGLQQIFDRYVERVRALTYQSTSDGAPAMFDAFARAYARQFTHDDLLQIRAFLSTPAGARYLQRSSEMLSDPDVAEANRAYMESTFRALQPLIEDLRRETQAYLTRQQHP